MTPGRATARPGASSWRVEHLRQAPVVQEWDT